MHQYVVAMESLMSITVMLIDLGSLHILTVRVKTNFFMNLSFFRIFVLVIFTIFIGNTVMAQILYDFNTESKLENWFIVNDDVMGGVSKSKLFLDYEGNGVFKGRISTLNNGGFASVRFNSGRVITKNKKDLVIKIKGDQKKYQIRIKSNRNDYQSYVMDFITSGEWETIKIPLKSMYASFRGRRLNIDDFDKDYFEQISILVGNKRNENFMLRIKSVELK